MPRSLSALRSRRCAAMHALLRFAPRVLLRGQLWGSVARIWELHKGATGQHLCCENNCADASCDMLTGCSRVAASKSLC
jgi:hypothetical protein